MHNAYALQWVMHEVFENRAGGPDALVLGAGPAGLAIASELAATGMQVVCVAPDPDAPWPANYGLWRDDLGELHELACIERSWRKPFVRLDGERRIDLDRTYGRFDNDTLQAFLRRRFVDGAGRCRAGRAVEVDHHDEGSTVTFDDGTSIATSVVIDATGPNSPFVTRPPRRPAFQAAYGELLHVDGHGFDPDEMVLMDFSGDDDVPTFLYAMPMSDELIFVEETSLVSRPPMDRGLLRRRLERRVAKMGLSIRSVVDREDCLIPMGHGLPHRGQRAIAYGSCASFVHPATGYQIARALRLARPTATAIADGLARSPQQAAARAYAQMWPVSARRAWELYMFGMEVLVKLDASDMRTFMESFFALPHRAWWGYMSGTLSPWEVASAMGRLFMSGGDIRSMLVEATDVAISKPLWRAMIPGGVR